MQHLTPSQLPQTTAQPMLHPSAVSTNPDEINLLEYIYALVKHKWLIIGLTFLGLVAGYTAALIKGPTWVAEAVIAPREAESQKMPSFSGLGALGGIVASQLNLGGNASLEKIDLILDSREFGAELFFMIVMLVVFAHAFTSADKTDEDRMLIKKIREEISIRR
jgi:hypothetical protein